MFFLFDGHEIHFSDDGQGEALLLLHGLGGNALNWTYQRQYFATRRRVICVDLPGHGKSGGKDIPFTGYGRVVLALLDHLRIDRCALVGLAKGARVGIEVAARWPARVSALVAVNTCLHLDPADHTSRVALYDVLVRGAEGKVAWATELLDRMAIPEGTRIHRGFMRSLDTLDAAHVRTLFQEILDHDQRQEAAAVACPTLLIRGGRDGLVPAYCHEVLQAAIPDCTSEVFDDCGHLPYLESPDRFNRAVETFLARDGA